MKQREDGPAILISIEEAASRLRVGRTTVFKLIRDGDIESVKIGRLSRILPASLDDYVAKLQKHRK